jgi:hypothetical protein
VYATPPLDSNDFIDNQPPAPPLVLAKLPNVDASGRWWYAGDYMKYVETTSYTTALMEIGIRDFPTAMGSEAPLRPPTPPSSISYADNSGCANVLRFLKGGRVWHLLASENVG